MKLIYANTIGYFRKRGSYPLNLLAALFCPKILAGLYYFVLKARDSQQNSFIPPKTKGVKFPDVMDVQGNIFLVV